MDYKKQSTGRLMLRFVIPQTIALVCNSVYFIVDGVFIGLRLGEGALAAAGVAVPVVEGMIALSMLVAVGAGILVSTAFGRKDGEAARTAFDGSIVLSLLLSLLAVLAGSLFIRPLATALGAGPAILEDTTAYLGTFLVFSPFLIFSFVLSTAARNDGAPRLAMVALTVGSLSNILLDWIFMYPLNMGITGAALATGLGPVFSILILLPHFLRKKGGLWLRPVKKAALRLLGRILLGGLPAFVTEFSIGIVTLLYNLALVKNGFGDNGLAVYLVLGYAALICLTAFLGAAQGVQPLVSYFAAEGNHTRIAALKRATVLFCGGMSLVMYLLLALFGRGFYGIFLSTPALVAQAVSAGRLYFLCLPLAAANILLLSFAQSVGRVRYSLLVSLGRSTLPVLLFLQLLPLAGAMWLWLALAAAELCTLLPALVLQGRPIRAKKDTGFVA